MYLSVLFFLREQNGALEASRGEKKTKENRWEQWTLCSEMICSVCLCRYWPDLDGWRRVHRDWRHHPPVQVFRLGQNQLRPRGGRWCNLRRLNLLLQLPSISSNIEVLTIREFHSSSTSYLPVREKRRLTWQTLTLCIYVTCSFFRSSWRNISAGRLKEGDTSASFQVFIDCTVVAGIPGVWGEWSHNRRFHRAELKSLQWRGKISRLKPPLEARLGTRPSESTGWSSVFQKRRLQLQRRWKEPLKWTEDWWTDFIFSGSCSSQYYAGMAFAKHTTLLPYYTLYGNTALPSR